MVPPPEVARVMLFPLEAPYAAKRVSPELTVPATLTFLPTR